jgi:signal transduction histidine kinase
MTVSDNGKGFSVENRNGHGIGLVSMRERIDALGGQLAIISTPGEGTIIQVRISLDSQVMAGEIA